ncbi:MAG: DUF5681 domain-containing protein [Pantoea sp.]|nr:DUF5681 domain-containing protein [Pantoea sp.]
MAMTKKPLPQQFKQGTSGNPRGRPKGARNRSTTVLMQGVSGELMAEDYAAIVRKMSEQAKAGDAQAAKLLLPRYKATMQPVKFDLDTSSPVAMADSILGAVASGKLPADVGQHLTGMIADRMAIEERSDMREQLEQLTEQMTRLMENRR